VPENSAIIERVAREVNGLSSCHAKLRTRQRRCIALLMLAWMFLSVGCESDDDKADALYRQANDHVKAGNLEQAVVLFDQVIREYPDSEATLRARENVAMYRDLTRAEDNFSIRRAEDALVHASRAVQRYQSKRGRWPERLADLVPTYMTAIPHDPWGNPLLYRPKTGGRGFLMACLGSDGKVGGSGEARDLFIEDAALVGSPSVAWP